MFLVIWVGFIFSKMRGKARLAIEIDLKTFLPRNQYLWFRKADREIGFGVGQVMVGRFCFRDNEFGIFLALLIVLQISMVRFRFYRLTVRKIKGMLSNSPHEHLNFPFC
jgi:hypothetical protein